MKIIDAKTKVERTPEEFMAHIRAQATIASGRPSSTILEEDSGAQHLSKSKPNA